MGLFDGLINGIFNRLGDTVENKVNNAFAKIPEKYNEFPKYNGEMIGRPTETVTNTYSRCTIMYKGVIGLDYISEIINKGYVQGSKVRYDKDNTYIIIEYSPIRGMTKLVYHIKN